MQKPTLIFESSPLFLLLCLVLGVALAYFLYRKKSPWGEGTKRILIVLRSISFAIIASLLVSPVLKQIDNTTERPTLVVAVDNSESISEVLDSVSVTAINTKVDEVIQQAAGKYDVEYRTINVKGNSQFPAYDEYSSSSSDLNTLLRQVDEDYEGRNLGGVILVSDGIYNEGTSPTYTDFSFPVYAVGVGDTIPKSDVSITSLLYNKISYQGNKFPLIVQVASQNYKGKVVNVSVSQGGKVIDAQKLTLAGDNQLEELKFLISADNKGYQRYKVSVEAVEGEFSVENNVKQAYVEVIEGKEQIAIIANSPHPDIKAIKSAIETNQNYKVDQYLLSDNSDVQKLQALTTKYDLIIYHQLPDQKGRSNGIMNKLTEIKTNTLTVFGSATNVRTYNNLHKELLTINAVPSEYDQVTAVFNEGFANFKLSDELQKSFDEFPPLEVPFGKIETGASAQVMLYQKIGSVATNRPLLAIEVNSDNKNAVFLGDGLWKWKLLDYAKNEDNKKFNELISKLVQYLSSKEDKRKFRAYPVKNEFLTSEKVVFETEVYNDLYERVYGNKIDITIKNESGENKSYSFVTNQNNTKYEIGGLEEGVYNYSATTTIEGQRQSVSGQFLVKELRLEALNLTADFNLLRALSFKSGGEFYTSSNLSGLSKSLMNLPSTGIIHSSEKYLPFINLKWVFFLILTLLSVEWFLRKYYGSY